MPNALSSFTRRGLLLLTGASALSACARDRFRLEPVVIGGVAVLPEMTIMEAIDASADHRRLADALRASGLDEPLSGPGPFTLLAPTDRAFEGIRPKSDGERVRGDPAILKRTLRSHIFPAQVSKADITAGIDANGADTKALGLNGLPVTFDRKDGILRAFDPRGRRALLGPVDAIAANGLIHVIDEVLLLPEEEQDEAAKVLP